MPLEASSKLSMYVSECVCVYRYVSFDEVCIYRRACFLFRLSCKNLSLESLFGFILSVEKSWAFLSKTFPQILHLDNEHSR